VSERLRRIQAQYDHAQDKVDAQQQYLDSLSGLQLIHFAPAARRKLDKLTDAATALWQQLHGIHDQEVEMTPCKSLDCPERLTRHEAFEQAGRCLECFEIATGKRPAPPPTWGDLHPPAIN
jgi:hypothetical protein